MESLKRNPEVERELERLVKIVIEVFPGVEEIRALGSYNRQKGKPEESHINVYIETDLLFGRYDREDREELEREIKQKLKRHYNIIFYDRYDISQLISDPLYGKDMRILYERNYSQKIETNLRLRKFVKQMLSLDSSRRIK